LVLFVLKLVFSKTAARRVPRLALEALHMLAHAYTCSDAEWSWSQRISQSSCRSSPRD